MNKIKWKRPSGSEIETNDLEGTVDHCISLGWKPVKIADPPKPKKAQRKK